MDYELRLLRFSTQQDDTLGILFGWPTEKDPKGPFLCFTLEDEYREIKKQGETRIPAGRYEIKLRKEGGFHAKYGKTYPAIHKGMLHLQNVPGFEYILIHCGNSDDDTAGCILVGDSCQRVFSNGFEGYIAHSSSSYQRIYPPIASLLEQAEKTGNGDRVFITLEDR